MLIFLKFYYQNESTYIHTLLEILQTSEDMCTNLLGIWNSV